MAINRVFMDELVVIEPKHVDQMSRVKCQQLLHETLDATDLLGMSHQDIDDMDARNCREKLKEVIAAAEKTLAA